ncbi:MAG TPA: 16S rRNA (guanine(966)-N(2))-methyltransferase RsmD [Clostridiaceae bacterium]|nr:16S rRNA (guanine(966)-N(2))-methyltransferase RsmD [Clostridiaceae bacterium]
MEGIDILRVITGTARGHKLKTVKGLNTRPTSDKVKGALFNILAGRIEGSNVLDLFAGTGNLGIEALSRGAASAVFIDKSPECISVIKENLKHTKLEERATVIPGDVMAVLKKMSNNFKKYDIIFMDPPYNKNLIQDTLKIIEENGIIKNDGIVVVEKSAKDDTALNLEKLKLFRVKRYGDTVLSFFTT